MSRSDRALDDSKLSLPAFALTWVLILAFCVTVWIGIIKGAMSLIRTVLG